MNHLQKVAISACEQCGRNRIPEVLPLTSLQTWLGTQINQCTNPSKATSTNKCFILSPLAKKGLRDFYQSPTISGIALLAGPEGGFTPDEEAAAMVAGFVPLRLGERILRTETAALAAIAAMQAVWGDY